MNNELNFTGNAKDVLAKLISSPDFQEDEGQMIYESLQTELNKIRFCDYLKRYIYTTHQLDRPFRDVADADYKKIILDGLKKSSATLYFDPLFTSTKEGNAVDNWLSQASVSRTSVFLLGFALKMSPEEVNEFLTKGLCEQEINAKIPFEVICWYCLKNGFDYKVFQDLTWQYEELQPSDFEVADFSTAATSNIRNTMFAITSPQQLMTYLSGLKASTGMSKYSRTAKLHFDLLYMQTKQLIAELFNCTNWQHEKKETVTWDQISANQVEEVIYAGIPRNKQHNLQKERDSSLYAKFPGMRLSKKRLQNLSGKGGNQEAEVSRYDLITLNFFIYSQKFDEFDTPAARLAAFAASTNMILESCFMRPLILQNPYENFVLSCMYSEDPLYAYSTVWEESYGISL